MMSGRRRVVLATLAVTLGCLGAVSLQPQTWDVLDETYGSGPGEVSFNACYTCQFGSAAPSETLSAGKATLLIPSGTGVVYPAKAPAIPAWPGGNADITIEWKMAFRQGGSAVVFLSEQPATGSSRWDHTLLFDLTYCACAACYRLDALADYAKRVDNENLAPPGFDSSVPHVYRIVRRGGASSLYVDDDPVPLLASLANGVGAAPDHLRWIWGFYPQPASPSEVDVYYLKGAQGAFPPPATPPEDVRLTVTRNADELTFTWDAAGFVLQHNSHLGNADCWARVTGGERSPATLPLAAATTFYRLANGAPADAVVLDVGSSRQLFIDDLFIECPANVRLRTHPAAKTHVRTLHRERPWESATLSWFNVLQEETRHRIWYECYDVDGWPTADDTSFCQAESANGTDWTRPDLLLFSYQGSRENNILFRLIGPATACSRVHGAGVFVDPTAPPDARYKAVSQGTFQQGFDPPQRIAGMYSADGLQWTRYPAPICTVFADSQYSAFWDLRLQKYVLYGRVGGQRGRALGRSESHDFSHFDPLSLVLETDDRDPPNSDLYNPAALQYPYATNVYFMFPSLYQHAPDTLDVRLAVSRDGVHWTWPERVPFIPLGQAGDFDSASIYMGQGWVRSGDELWQYYAGSPLKHNQAELENLVVPGNGLSYSRVVSRLDGFVSVDAGTGGGSFVTPPLRFAGNRLTLNVQVHTGGSLRVGLLDTKCAPVADRTTADCVPITADGVRLPVRWNSGADVSARAQLPTRLCIEFDRASLFAFQFREEP